MMKSLIKIVPFALICLGFSSCLKDEPYTPDTNAAENVIEFSGSPSSSSSASRILPVYNEAFDVVALDTISVPVSYSGSDAAPQDITVNLAIDNTALEAYNAKIIADARTAAIEAGEDPDEAEAEILGDLFDEMPASLYTLLTPTVTIKKGEKTASALIAVKPEQFDFTYRYGLPLTIKSASMGNISGNFRTSLFYVSAKNEYDGAYSLVGQLSPVTDRPTINTSSEFEWPGDGDIFLVTATSNAVDIYDNYYSWGGGINQWINPIGTATGGFSSFGMVRPRITFDNATHQVVSVTNMYPNPTNGRALSLDPDYDSHYDPETGVLDVRYIMTQPGFQPLTITYKFTYKDSR